MQTFLTIAKSDELVFATEELDDLRLGKQRVEGYQIMRALLDPKYGWQNHPAVKMWRGYFFGLKAYVAGACIEWSARGYKDSMYEKVCALHDTAFVDGHLDGQAMNPPWWTDEFTRDAIIESHRRALITKAEWDWLERGDERAVIFYKERNNFGLEPYATPEDIAYIWPISQESSNGVL